MHPTLIPGLPFQTYGACIALGVLLCWALVERLSGRKDLSTLVFLLVAVGIVGARIAHVVEYWQADGFDENFLAAFQVWTGGLVFYGGLAAAIGAFLIWCAVKKESVLHLADLLLVAVPLGHAFGRLGCFFFGCCWGKLAPDSCLGVSFPAHSPVWAAQVQLGQISFHAPQAIPVLPTQLFEAGALFVLFAVLVVLYRRFKAWTAATYFCGYGLVRFFLEFLRDDARPVWGGLSSAQSFSLFLIVLGISFFIWSFHVQHSSHHR